MTFHQTRVDGFSDVDLVTALDVVQKGGQGFVPDSRWHVSAKCPISVPAVAMIGRFYEHYNELEICGSAAREQAFPDVAKDSGIISKPIWPISSGSSMA